jgi:hypothetical protein
MTIFGDLARRGVFFEIQIVARRRIRPAAQWYVLYLSLSMKRILYLVVYSDRFVCGHWNRCANYPATKRGGNQWKFKITVHALTNLSYYLSQPDTRDCGVFLL